MKLIMLSSQTAFEDSQQAIDRREPFQLVVEGFTARIVRKLSPFFQSHWGSHHRRMTRIDILKYAVYGLFAGNFSAVYYAAFKAGMDASWDDTRASIVVTFEARE